MGNPGPGGAVKNLRELKASDIVDFLKTVDKKSWIKIGVAAGAGVLLCVFFVWPAWVGRFGLQGKIQGLQNQIAGTDALVRKKPDLERQKQDFMQSIAQARARIYEPGEVSLLLGAVSKLAQESGVAIVSSQPKVYEDKLPEPYAQQVEAKAFSFIVEGGYHELGQFINRIESSVKMLKIDWFELKPQEENSKHLADLRITALAVKKAVAPA
jgi:Tfp pilus assembly protein PilO